MILHLKRFEFDLEQMRKVKVNDYVHFPEELNMKPYTKEGLQSDEDMADETEKPAGYYEYKLKGVLIHSGTSESGHYYSIAKDRGKEKSAQDGAQESSWSMFNDSSVTPFDSAQIGDQCFGGIKPVSKWDAVKQRSILYNVDKQYSAYMLIYERAHIEFATDSAWRPQFGEDALLTLKKPSAVVPEDIFKDLWANNKKFLCDKNLYSCDFSDFLLDVTKPLARCKGLGLEEGVLVVTTYVFDVLIHAKEKNNLVAFFKMMVTWFDGSVNNCTWLLERLTGDGESSSWIRNILLRCPTSEIRSSFVKLMEVVFEVVCPLERNGYYEEDGDEIEFAKGRDAKEKKEREKEGHDAELERDLVLLDEAVDRVEVYGEGQESGGERFRFW